MDADSETKNARRCKGRAVALRSIKKKNDAGSMDMAGIAETLERICLKAQARSLVIWSLDGRPAQKAMVPEEKLVNKTSETV